MTNMEFKGSANRIRNCAWELLSIGDDLMDDDDATWDLMGRELQLKSTFLYCDFNVMISSAPKDQKKALVDLADKLLCSIEELDNAVKIRSMPLAHDRYDEVAGVLQEVVAALVPPGT